jgi:hypothetical protein
MHKLWSESAQVTLVRLLIVSTVIMTMRLTLAHLTDITGQIILRAACLSAQGHGSMASTVVDGAATMVVDGVGTVVAVSMEDEAGTTVAVDLVVEADGMGVMDSAGTRASTVAEDSMVAASAAVAGFMAEADSTVAAMAEASTAVGEEDFMEAVAGSTEEEVVAGPMGEATGNRY